MLKNKSLEEIEKYYNLVAPNYPWLDNFSEGGSHWHRTEFFLKHIKNGDKILDCGCSNGGLAKYLTERFDKITLIGFDIAKYFVENASRNVSRGIFFNSSIEKISFAANSFDIIIAGEVLEHVIDVNNALKPLLHCLKMNGKLLITTPIVEDTNEQHIQFLNKEALEKYLPGIEVKYNRFSWLSCYTKL